MNDNILKIEHFSIGDYMLVSRLLAGDTVSWEESKIKLFSSRATNHATSVRKIIGNFDCIENEAVDTLASYYERYKLNPEYREKFQILKMMYESNERFINRLNKKLEKIAKFNESQGSY